MRVSLVSAVAVLLAAICPAAQEPSFDVASIRPSAGDSTQARDIRPTPFGRLTMTNATARSVILPVPRSGEGRFDVEYSYRSRRHLAWSRYSTGRTGGFGCERPSEN